MADSDETPAATEWRRAHKFYRRPLGLAWLVGVVLVPLLLGAIGYGVFDRPRSEANGPTGPLPTLTEVSSSAGPSSEPAVPGLSLAPMSIARNGNDITLTGAVPDNDAKAVLVDALKSSMGPGVNIIDQLTIDPNVYGLDFSHAGPVFNAAASIPDFNLSVSGDTVTLNGTATSADQEDAIETAAENAWPNLNIVDRMENLGPVWPTGTHARASVRGLPGASGQGNP